MRTGAASAKRSGARGAERFLNPGQHASRFPQFVFPNAKHAPVFPAKRAAYDFVTHCISGQLLHPEGTVAGWNVGMLWTAMPEAAIHKHRNPEFGKYEVGFTEDGLMAAPAGDVVTSEELHQGEFRLLVATSANPGHDIGAFRLCENVRH